MSIDERFADFHRDNPHIFDELKTQALRFKARGATRLSAKALYEFTRTNHWLSVTTGEPWKLNNDYTSRYARLLMGEPELRGLFETRTLKEKSNDSDVRSTCSEREDTSVPTEEDDDFERQLYDSIAW